MSKSKNSNLHKAKKTRNDEFYTRLADIEKECVHYRKYFRGKTVFLNCDDPEHSEFWKYFDLNFEFFGLKKVIATHFDREKPTYKLETWMDGDKKRTMKTPLKQNGDFRSPECIELLKESDLVVTNPPFSLLREYIATLVEHRKKFLIVGTQNAITYKETFALIMGDKLWLGVTKPPEFVQPDGSTAKFGNACWLTNLQHKKRKEELKLYADYDPSRYPKYDGYDIIEVSRVADIPRDYAGLMGVPITFLEKYNPKQVTLEGVANSARWLGNHECYTVINGKRVYNRLLIKHRAALLP